MTTDMYQESYIQQGAVQWFRLQYPTYWRLLIKVPNEAKRDLVLVRRKDGSYRYVCPAAQRAKAEGMVKGAADMLLLVPRGGYGSLAIEFKSPKGKASEDQVAWLHDFEAAGNKACICRSVDDFIEMVTLYMNGNLKRQ